VTNNVLDTNVVGCFRFTRAFLPLLKKGDASIVLIGSYFGSIAGAINLSHLAYESSKFALEGLADGIEEGRYKC
jgi:NAD(P)-dependent dehydrogenase (short-subunit alcohol dehydrogenase family)